ncbi:hypothetical protein DDZ18_12155 [Marinicauda salina]|uniref:DUF4199 domain-containing protein n=1 Tax=Marinicauda salina TaxID=2135793 RepID=A0A2U2BR91_9PROT|nr:hypothetical protein [Marinicauda salina]PWE16516.1 hypothetical protein DDZ18_12155 [Marinicauda salina]
MNLHAAFLPGRRADADDYWLGLGVVALLDAIRLSVFPAGTGWLVWLFVLVLLFVVHANRLRDASRPRALALAPIGAGVLAKTLGATVGITAAIWPVYLEFLDRRGIDLADAEAVERAARDQALMEDFQAWMLDQETMMIDALAAGGWPSMIAFWGVVFALGFWFAGMTARGPRPA